MFRHDTQRRHSSRLGSMTATEGFGTCICGTGDRAGAIRFAVSSDSVDQGVRRGIDRTLSDDDKRTQYISP
jgi:hypothetical protein